MKVADLTKEQRKELLAWAGAGFREYANLCEKRGEEWVAITKENARIVGKTYNHTPAQLANMIYQGSIHHNIRTQIEAYAKEFGRVLRDEVEMSDEDDPLTLGSDLHGLMKSGCPPVELVELMLACTSDYGVTIPDLLMTALPLNDCLRRIPENARHFRIPRRPRRFKGAVPLSIQFMLEMKPYHACADGMSQAARVAFHVAYLYTFLKHFRYGHETATRLLRTMQFVRRRVPAVADYLKTRGRDTFRAGALQRRVLRFFKSNPASESAMRQDVRDYLAGKGGGGRKTLLGIY